jgi:hypothetical protein
LKKEKEKNTMIVPGQYKARAVKDGIQLGETDKGTLQVAIDLDVKDPQDNRKSLGVMTTFLYFSPEAAPYSYERLRALGWKGKGPDDIDNKDGIDANEVEIRVTQPEQYKATDGTIKMGVSKVEILTGAGQVKLSKPLDSATFKSRLKAIGGSGGGSSAPAPTGGGGSAPPF